MEKSILLSEGELKINGKHTEPDFGDIRRIVLGVHGLGGNMDEDIQVNISEEMDLFSSATLRFDFPCHGKSPMGDGSFTLHLTLHKPTRQPVDTLYTLRLDAGRETVISLIFLREAFNYKEPVFPPTLLDEFMRKKLDARRTR